MPFSLRRTLAEAVPSLGILRRYFSALIASCLPAKDSYAQFGEDKLLSALLETCGASVLEQYIDIGANHPTDISNSYLFYRRGQSGLTIEPNSELAWLHQRFRPNDVTIAVGCSAHTTAMTFNISKTPVCSTFSQVGSATALKKQVLPLVPLDSLADVLVNGPISFVSIDVEGMNRDVLEGARHTLRRARLLCIEFDSRNDIEEYASILGRSWEIAGETPCNVVFRNIEVALTPARAVD